MTVLLVYFSGNSTFAQEEKKVPQNEPYKQAPQPTEKVIGIVTDSKNAGWECDCYLNFYYYGSETDAKKKRDQQKAYLYKGRLDKTYTPSEEEMLKDLMKKATNEYGEKYPKYSLRNFKFTKESSISDVSGEFQCQNYFGTWRSHISYYYYGATEGGYYGYSTENGRSYTCKYSASVVIPDPKEEANEGLSSVVDKAMRNINKGSRLAIDQITVYDSINKDDFTDKLIDMLLDKGYKVVAKEYLSKLFTEQQNQQSGVYNDETVVQGKNFSAVGYYINVKVTKTTLRVQVVNVSTGEYEGNATLNL